MLFQSLLFPLALPLAAAQLNQLAVRAGLEFFGTAASEGQVNNAPYRALLTNRNEFGQLTPENGQKWDSTEPRRGQFSYGSADVVPGVAAGTGQILRCHTLTWYSQLPSWGKL